MRYTSIIITLLVTFLVTSINLYGDNQEHFLQHDNTLRFYNFDNDKFGSVDELNKKRRRHPLYAYSKGRMFISAGYGTPNMSSFILAFLDEGAGFEVSSFGPIHLKTEYAVGDFISLGLSVNLASSNATWKSEYEIMQIDSSFVLVDYYEGVKNYSVAINFRMNVHWYVSKHIDFYTGLGVGYNYSRFEFWSDSELFDIPKIPNFLPIGVESGLGLRVMFNDHVGLYTELGYAKSLAQFGMVIKV